MEQGLGTIDEIAEFRSMARKCRRLADAISDGRTRDNLQRLAAEYEQRAQQHSDDIGDHPLMRW